MDVVMNCKCQVKSAMRCRPEGAGPKNALCVIGKAEARCYHRDGDHVIRPVKGEYNPNEEAWA